MDRKKIIICVFIVLALLLFFVGDFGRYLSLEYLVQQKEALQIDYENNQSAFMFGYFVLYVVMASLSLPGAAFLTLAGGALFGFWLGLLLVSFASTLGATIAFMIARFLFRQPIQARFSKQLRVVNEGIKRDGAFYLFALRMAPIFPFFMINLVMSVTPIKLWPFYWVSQVGMLLGTAIYVNAGTQLAEINTLQDIISPAIVFSMVLLAIFPFIARAGIEMHRVRKLYEPFNKPSTYDYNLVVIGAGSGGLVSAYIAAAVKARVLLIEKNKMGGDCLNTGCVPSKALIRSAKAVAQVNKAERYGLKPLVPEVLFDRVMGRVKAVIDQIEPHDSVERYTKLGVECLSGEASIVSPFEVEVNGQIFTTRSIVIATGARPWLPPIAGLQAKSSRILTSDSIWSIQAQPEHLIVLGAGPIGCELAQSFRRLGSRVTLVEMGDRLLSKEDAEVSDYLAKSFANDSVELLLNTQVASVTALDDSIEVTCQSMQGGEFVLSGDYLLVAVGRKANTSGLGLEPLGIELEASGTIKTDGTLRTIYPNILACGDVVGPYQFTHMAAHQAWYAAVNALFGWIKTFNVNYSLVPAATFVDPEVARVGLNERDAKLLAVSYEVTQYDLDDLDRAIADGENHGFVKVLTVPGRDKILGVTIVGAHAAELLAEFVLAMKHGLGLNKILGTTHIYPTWSEANRYVAGEWKRAHVSSWVMSWLAKFHAQRRCSGGEKEKSGTSQKNESV